MLISPKLCINVSNLYYSTCINNNHTIHRSITAIIFQKTFDMLGLTTTDFWHVINSPWTIEYLCYTIGSTTNLDRVGAFIRMKIFNQIRNPEGDTAPMRASPTANGLSNHWHIIINWFLILPPIHIILGNFCLKLTPVFNNLKSCQSGTLRI